MRKLAELIVLIKGGGEVASGIAHKLHRCHFRVCLTETDNPLAVSRGTTFSEAVFDGVKTIEGVTAELASTSPEDICTVWQRGNIPVVKDPHTSLKKQLEPDVFVDAIMAKKNTDTRIADAPLVIGMGTGFYAGRDVHIVVETSNSNNLGRLIFEGEAERDTGTPIAIGGLTKERVIWASQRGIFTSNHELGDRVAAGDIVGWVGKSPLAAPLSGILRGLIRSGVAVTKGCKLVEIDPLNDRTVCYIIRDKMRTIAGGVLEAIMMKFNLGV